MPYSIRELHHLTATPLWSPLTKLDFSRPFSIRWPHMDNFTNCSRPNSLALFLKQFPEPLGDPSIFTNAEPLDLRYCLIKTNAWFPVQMADHPRLFLFLFFFSFPGFALPVPVVTRGSLQTRRTCRVPVLFSPFSLSRECVWGRNFRSNTGKKCGGGEWNTQEQWSRDVVDLEWFSRFFFPVFFVVGVWWWPSSL